MSKPGGGVLDELVEDSIAAAGTGNVDEAARLLLADLIACVRGAGPRAAPHGWAADGTTGLTAALAACAHARDQDDLHRATMVHPGSVVWPVVLALGAEVGATGTDVVAAARAGYTAMTGLAAMLGPTHARSWHATATCGGLGAAVAAAMLVGLDPGGRQRAAAHALAVAGGVGQSVLERSGSTVFHRVSAAVTGIQAARLAASGLSASQRVLDGDRGVLALMRPAAEPPEPTPARAATGTVETSAPGTADVLAATSVRLFPVNGFAQAAVALAAELRSETEGDVQEIVVEVSDAVASATNGAVGGRWWDLRSAVASAWTSGDPFLLESSAESDRVRELITVVAVPGLGQTTRLHVRTAVASRDAESTAAPGTRLADPASTGLLARKWDRLVWPVPAGAAVAAELATTILAAGPRVPQLRAMLPTAEPGDPGRGS